MKEQIKEILEEFDFNKVENVMTFLDWKWDNKIPTTGTIVVQAFNLLEEVYEKCEKYKQEITINSGGFNATAYYFHKDKIRLSLKFTITSWITN
jgi:hypothetical protein